MQPVEMAGVLSIGTDMSQKSHESDFFLVVVPPIANQARPVEIKLGDCHLPATIIQLDTRATVRRRSQVAFGEPGAHPTVCRMGVHWHATSMCKGAFFVFRLFTSTPGSVDGRYAPALTFAVPSGLEWKNRQASALEALHLARCLCDLIVGVDDRGAPNVSLGTSGRLQSVEFAGLADESGALVFRCKQSSGKNLSTARVMNGTIDAARAAIELHGPLKNAEAVFSALYFVDEAYKSRHVDDLEQFFQRLAVAAASIPREDAKEDKSKIIIRIDDRVHEAETLKELLMAQKKNKMTFLLGTSHQLAEAILAAAQSFSDRRNVSNPDALAERVVKALRCEISSQIVYFSV